MNRAEMINRIVGILTPPHPVTADAAAALILDAVLPQISADAWAEGFQAACDETPMEHAPDGPTEDQNPYLNGGGLV